MAIAALSGWTSEQKHVVAASFLGWSLDAFDFFLLVFVLKDIAAEFHTDISDGHLRDPADAGDAPDRRVHFRPRRRPLGPPADPDGRHPVVFGDRVRLRLLAQSDRADRAARALRRRDGRRMGRRRLADDGNHSAARARLRLRAAAIGLSGRLFHGLDRLWRAVSLYRLARHVHGRRDPGAAGALYPPQRSGIAELEQAGRGRARQHAGGAEGALAARDLCGGADDRVQFLQPRHAGYLPDLPAGAAQVHAARRQHHRGGLQYRRDLRRHPVRLAVGTVRAAPLHRDRGAADACRRSRYGRFPKAR